MIEDQLIILIQDFGISGVLLFIWYVELRQINKKLGDIVLYTKNRGG